MKARHIGRRAFIARASLGIAAAAASGSALAQMRGGGMGGGGMGGGGMGGGGVIDPPVGPKLADPPVAPNASGTAGVVDVSIEACIATVDVNGTPASLLTYDGSFIAPTIRARRGDVVRLHFRNSLPYTTATNLLGHQKNVTNVHVHGWHVSPGDNMEGIPADNVHVLVPAGGGSQDYEYDLALQRPGTLALYHPHVHGTVAEQFWGGLVGCLDVADDPSSTLAGIETHLVVLKDLTIAGGAPAPYESLRDYMQGKEGEVVTVNGQVNPYLPFRPGEVKRLRILNASNARFYRLSLQGHTLHVVGTDGGLLDKPYAVSEMLVSPGERLDVLVKGSATKGNYKLLALPYARMGNMASAQATLMTLQVSGSRASGAIPPAVNAGAVRLPADTTGLARARFVLSMGQGRGYVNGVSFQGMEQAYMHMSTLGTHEIWEIVNESGMDHPWHQHVNDGQVIAASGGDAVFAGYAKLMTLAPAWKDTIIVPKGGSITLRLPILDYEGMTMCHCHILEHEDIGMMAMWHIMGSGMPM
ncbi:MAG TPA: multicopper oxidase family protein [Anaeromyxobacter sp.]|nr:multicopper oxidase family protein [Anaeromyxobacter sp.]